MKTWFRRSRTTPAPLVAPHPPMPLLMVLEPRIMFDAAAVATGAEAAQEAATPPPPPPEEAPPPPPPDEPVQPPPVLGAPAAERHEVVFVDTRLPDYQQIVASVAPTAELVLIDTHTDGVQQIAAALAGRSGLDAVHIVSHGDEGVLLLGNGPLHGGNVDAYADALRGIGAALGSNGDIHLYGCDVGAGDAGRSLLAALAGYTGADVAASGDATGRGGDWALEICTGDVATSAALDTTWLQGYAHELATFSVSTIAELRTALSTAASNSAADTITLTASISATGTGSMNASATDSMRTFVDINITDGQALDIVGGGNTIDANYYGRVLEVRSGTVTMSNLTLREGAVSGNGGSVNAGAGVAAFGGGIRNAGTLTLSSVIVTANGAAAGGGAGTSASGYGAGGGGGGGMGGVGGGNGGTGGPAVYAGSTGGSGTGGNGGDYTTPTNNRLGGRGGSTSGGAGGALGGYASGGAGATANNGTLSIGGGGGGGNYAGSGGAGGSAAGAIYNTGTLTIVGSTVSNNVGAGGGGGAGGSVLFPGTGGAGGRGVGGLWNTGTLNLDATSYSNLATNTGAGGSGGSGNSGNGSAGGSSTHIFNTGTLNTNYSPPVAPSLAATGADPTFTEGGSAVDLFSSVTAATNDGGQTFSTMTLTVTNVSNGSSEILSIGGTDVALTNGNSGTLTGIGNFSVSVVSGTATVTLSGMTRSDAQMGTLVDGMTYRNTSDDPSAASARVVTVTGITDSGSILNSATPNRVSTVTLAAVNDAPTLTATGGTPSFTEGGSAVDLFSGVSAATVESGQTVDQLTLTVTNVADGSNEIFRADGSDIALTNGNSGTTSTNSMSYSVSVVAGTATVTLSSVAGISTAAAQTLVDGMSYRNTSDAPSTTSRVVTLTGVRDNGGTSNGGSNSTSLSVAATVSVTNVNDAPTLSGGPYSLTSTDENTTTSGTLVSTVLAGLTYADVDASPSSGIAITASAGNGTWQYSTDGVTWNGVGSVAGNSALLLSSTTRLRYVPDGQNGETATLTFHAWDQTNGTASTNVTRNTADTTSNGGSTAFSTGTAQATLTVTSVNDAPVLTPAAPTLTGLNDTDVNNAGQTVASFAGASVADVDSGAVEGIAITGLVAGTGTWQYSTDGGGNWSNVGSVSSGSALLLRSTDRVRLVPDGVNGTSASITYLGWDQTGATAGQQGTQVDASSTGGSTPFSSASDTASITVTAVNDAPTVTASGGTTAFTEGNNTTSTPVAVDSGLTLSDTDSPTLASATVSITGNFSSAQDVLAFTNDGSTMGNVTGSYNSTTGVLTLTSSGASATTAQWQAALRAVTYTNSSDTPSTSTRTVSFVVNDGAADSNAATKSVSVSNVNDSPVATVPATVSVTEDTATAITGISFSDADAGGSSVTATLSVGSGTLAATSGGGVTVGGTSSALTLTGSVANINTFIAGSNVTFTTASSATANVTLTTGINDGGNTGSGGAQTDSETTTLQVTAVNDAPSITAPGSISITEDVAGALTGISFSDVDAGSGSVTATLSVASGALAATSGGGVTAAGSGTGTLTLTGSVANINTFIAGSNVSFTTASNATSNVTLTVGIDDGGNTGVDPGNSGTGSSEAASTTVTLAVSAVNDAPVHSVPGAQTTDQDQTLVFSSGTGNLISVSDADAGGSSVRVTLTASNGLLTLAGTTGLSFSVGSGTGDATMTFDGTLTNVNSALSGLSFAPTAGYNGAASVQINTSDLGATGGGGTQTDTDTIAITVSPVNPVVTSVNVSNPDGGYNVGDTLSVTVSFDAAVTVDTTGGAPTLLLETGSTDRTATYVSGSGTSTLTFSYTVQAGDTSADLDYASTGALALNGATIRSASSIDAILTLPTVGGVNSIAGQHAVVVDGNAPAITSVAVPADATYVAGQNLDFTVNFSEAVVVDTSGGTPRIALTLDTGGTVYASYLGGSGTAALSFRATVTTGQLDATGVAVASALDLNGGTLRDAVGNSAVLTLNGVGSTVGVQVDAIAPTVATVSVPADGRYNAGDVLSFTVNTSETVTIASGTPRLALDIGGASAFATYVSGSGTSALVFQYTVQAGDTDADGIAIGTLQANGATLRDAAGNALALTLNGVQSTAGVSVDTTAPAATGIARVDATPTSAATINYTVTFSDDVSGVGLSDFTLVTTGSAAGTLSGITSIDARTYTVQVSSVSGDGTLRLDLNAGGTGIADLAGNAITGGLAGAVYTVDRVAPAVTSVAVPADATYVAGQNLDFTVSFSEAVTVDTTGGTPRIALTLDSGTLFASYLGGSGTTALSFRATVAAGQLDADGVAVASALDLNGSTLRDATGNDVTLALNAVASTAGVHVDATTPVATAIARADASPSSAAAVSYTVTFSEDVSGVDAADFTLATTGSATGSIGSVTAVDARTYVVEVTSVAGEGELGLNLNGSGTGIADAAGNAIATGVSGERYALSAIVAAPPPSAAPPAAEPLPTAPPQSPSAPAVTLSPLDPITPISTPTLNPTAGTSPMPSLVVMAGTPLGTDALFIPLVATTPGEARSGFIETGANTGAGLQAIPDLGDFGAQAGQTLRIALPTSTFVHSERNVQVSVEVRLSNGRPLPNWLRFDPVTGTLTGQPPRGMNQTLSLEITARDDKGNRATSHLDIEVRSTPASRDTTPQPRSMLIDPMQADTEHAAVEPVPLPGRAALDAQFDRHGSAAWHAERAALLEHARAVTHTPG